MAECEAKTRGRATFDPRGEAWTTRSPLAKDTNYDYQLRFLDVCSRHYLSGVSGEELEFSDVFKTSFKASIIAGILGALATAPMESVELILVTKAVLSILTTTVVVLFVCTTDVRTVVKIVLTYSAVQIVVALTMIFLLPMLGD